MKFTPGQVREMLSLSKDTYRHWKNALPPLAGRKGHTPCFTAGDLLAMAIVRRLTEEGGIRVGSLSPVAADLFDRCARGSWTAIERSTLILDLPGGSVTFVMDGHPPPTLEGPSIQLPCRHIV